MLAAVWGVYAGFGLVAGSLAPVIGAVRADLGLSRSAMGMVLGAWQLVYLAAAIPAGRLIDRAGLTLSLGVAAGLIAVSGVARAAATGLPSLLAAVALFGLGGPLVSIGAPKLIATWFSGDERRSAVGVYTTAPAVGTMVALLSANALLVPAFGSWRGAVATYGALAGVAGVVWVVVARRAPQPPAQAAAGAGGGARLSSRGVLAQAGVPLVLALAVGSFLYSHAVGNWLVELLRAGGRSPSLAGALAALTTLVGVAATAMVPRAATPPRRTRVLVATYSLGCAGIVAVPAVAGWAVIPLLVAVGVARAAAVPVAMLVLMDHPRIGPVNMAVAGGLFFTAGEIGGVLGPLLTGVAADASGGYQAPALLLAAVAGLMAVLASRLPRPDVRRDAACGLRAR